MKVFSSQLSKVVGRDVVATLQPVEVFEPVSLSIATFTLNVSRLETSKTDLPHTAIGDADTLTFDGKEGRNFPFKLDRQFDNAFVDEWSGDDSSEKFDPL